MFKIQKITKMNKRKSVEIVPIKNIGKTEIGSKDYQKLLSKVQNQINKTQKRIVESTTRERVVMGWQVGKIIEEHLSKNSKSGYGERLFAQLEKDALISERVLYQMRSFYKTYKTLPKDDAHLNWSHYRVLAGIKKTDERKYLEDLARENSWDSDRLQEEVKKTKDENKAMSESLSGRASRASSKTFAQKDLSERKLKPALKPTRGK